MCYPIISKKKLRKMLRYFIMYLAVYLLAQYVVDCNTQNSSLIIAVSAAVVFVFIDMYFPVLCE